MKSWRYVTPKIFVKRKSTSPAAIGKRMAAMKASETPKDESVKSEMSEMPEMSKMI
jgi:hypothetical protein